MPNNNRKYEEKQYQKEYFEKELRKHGWFVILPAVRSLPNKHKKVCILDTVAHHPLYGVRLDFEQKSSKRIKYYLKAFDQLIEYRKAKYKEHRPDLWCFVLPPKKSNDQRTPFYTPENYPLTYFPRFTNPSDYTLMDQTFIRLLWHFGFGVCFPEEMVVCFGDEDSMRTLDLKVETGWEYNNANSEQKKQIKENIKKQIKEIIEWSDKKWEDRRKSFGDQF